MHGILCIPHITSLPHIENHILHLTYLSDIKKYYILHPKILYLISSSHIEILHLTYSPNIKNLTMENITSNFYINISHITLENSYILYLHSTAKIFHQKVLHLTSTSKILHLTTRKILNLISSSHKNLTYYIRKYLILHLTSKSYTI